MRPLWWVPLALLLGACRSQAPAAGEKPAGSVASPARVDAAAPAARSRPELLAEIGRRFGAGLSPSALATLAGATAPVQSGASTWTISVAKLEFDGRLLGAVLRIFIDTVGAWYRARQERRGLGGGATGAVAVIQRGSSDLRLNPHFHVLFLDGVYRPDGPDEAPVFHPAAGPAQADVEEVVHRARKRILRYLERRGAITVVTAPGDGELTVAGDEGLGESDPLLAGLLAAAVAGAPPAGPAAKAPARAIDIACHRCGGPLRLIALVKTEATIKKILTAMGLPAEAPPVHHARPPPGSYS